MHLVADLARATAFYQAIGAVKNDQFSDATASGMVFSDTIHVMLLTHDKFRQFTQLLDAPPARNPGLERLMAVKPPWSAKTGKR